MLSKRVLFFKFVLYEETRLQKIKYMLCNLSWKYTYFEPGSKSGSGPKFTTDPYPDISVAGPEPHASVFILPLDLDH